MIFKSFLRGADQKLCAFSEKKHSNTFLFTRQFNFTVSQNIRSFNMNKSKKDIFDQGRDLLPKFQKWSKIETFYKSSPFKYFLLHTYISPSKLHTSPCTQSINKKKDIEHTVIKHPRIEEWREWQHAFRLVLHIRLKTRFLKISIADPGSTVIWRERTVVLRHISYETSWPVE